jgi:hypothetical protein
VWAQRIATIPLVDNRLPADDLLVDGRIIRPDEAHSRAQRGLDLSVIDPAPSAVWSPERRRLSGNEDALNINDGDLLQFQGDLNSALGLYRFNATIGSTTAIIHLDKTLHSTLLRKNFLRLLGYRLPPMKWLRRVTVRFNSQEELRDFLRSRISRFTIGAGCRWAEKVTFRDPETVEEYNDDQKKMTDCPSRAELGDDFTVSLRDVAVTVPAARDHFNLALDIPPMGLTSRTLRAVLIPYALLNLGESANVFEWTVGLVSNNEILLPHHSDKGIFPTTIDDARWILNRLKDISQEEIRQAVELAHFPPEVAALLVEKISARRNSLLKLFRIDAPELPVDRRVSLGADLDRGKLKRQVWSGYASRFAYGDPESPFRDFHWFALSKLQSVAIDNLVALANRQIVLTNPNEVRKKFHRDQFQRGLEHFVRTGEFLEFPVDTWLAPSHGIDLRASRDVVVGNYLGTDNLVQIADSIGMSFRIGAHLGIENIWYFPTTAVGARVTASRSWTHLKPLRNLKQAMKEPYRNMAVPLLKWQIARDLTRLGRLADSENPTEDWNYREDNSELARIIRHLNDNLGVGESLIFTETVSPTLGASASSNAFLGGPVAVKITGAANLNIIRRIQILRRDAKTIQIYDDVGNSRGWNLELGVEKLVSISRIGWGSSRGDYTVRQHEVNIDPDTEANPRLFEKAHALSQFIQTGSSELLTAIEKPNYLRADFVDKTFRFSFLAWRLKRLKAETEYQIESRDGLTGRFVSFSDEKQTGLNWEAFTRDLINLGLAEIYKDLDIGSSPNQNPAETIGGVGKTTAVRFEAALDEDNRHEERFMRLTERWEGWSAKASTVQRYMTRVNEKIGATIFHPDSIQNTRKLKLFNVAFNVNLYEPGIERLSNLNTDRIYLLENFYEEREGMHLRPCPGQVSRRRLSTGRVLESCGSFSSLISAHLTCQTRMRRGKKEMEVSKCLTRLFREAYEKLDWADLKGFIGEQNMFITGSVNGFRNGDEVLNDPIMASTQGEIGSRFWNGPLEVVQRMLGISSGELNGYWMRERL